MTHQSVQRIESLLVPEVRYDISPLGTGKNWVTEVGGLPTMARAIAHALIRSGHSESSAIATAIAALKRWAAGGGNVHPSTRARAAAAVAEWEAKKLAAHASRQDDTAAKERRAVAILERRAGPRGYIHGWIKVSGDALKEHLVDAHGADRGKVGNADDRRLESAHSGFHRHMRESVPAHSHTHSHSSGLNTTTHTHHMVGLAPSKSGRMSRHELIHKHGDLPLHIHEA